MEEKDDGKAVVLLQDFNSNASRLLRIPVNSANFLASLKGADPCVLKAEFRPPMTTPGVGEIDHRTAGLMILFRTAVIAINVVKEIDDGTVVVMLWKPTVASRSLPISTDSTQFLA